MLKYRHIAMMLVAACATADTAQDLSNSSVSIEQESPTITQIYLGNREKYVRSISELQAELSDTQERIGELDKQIATTLESIAKLRSKSIPLAPLQPAEEAKDALSGLRIITWLVEKLAFFLLFPLFSFVKLFFGFGSLLEGMGQSPGVFSMMSDAIRVVMSLLMVSTFFFAALFLKKYHNHYYSKYQKWIWRLMIVFAIVLPLSAFAEESPPLAVGAIIEKADGLLARPLIERYLLDLESKPDSGEWYTVTGLPLASPFLPLTSRVRLGSIEHHTLMAVLYEMTGQDEKVIEKLRLYSNPAVELANNSGPIQEQYLVAVISSLLARDYNDLAAEVLEKRIGWVNSLAGALRLHELFADKSLSVSANAVASAALGKANNFDEQFMTSQILFERSDATSARLALKNALRSSKKIEQIWQVIDLAYQKGDTESGQSALKVALESFSTDTQAKKILKIAIDQDETEVIIKLIEQIEGKIRDASQYFAIYDTLQRAGRLEESREVIKALIDRASTQGVTSINGDKRPKTDILRYISNTCFELGLYDQAERSGQLLIRSLPREQRASFIIPPPDSMNNPLVIPQPEALAAPLYFGLLYEAMQASAKAETLYEREFRSQLDAVIESNGLNVPNMLNHMFLYGESLIRRKDEETLAVLDKLVKRLEEKHYQQSKAVQAVTLSKLQEEIEIRNERLAAVTGKYREEKAALQAPLVAVTPAVEESRGTISLIYSSIMLPVRIVAIIVYLLVFAIAIVAISWRFSREFETQRFYAFVSKILENVGWVYVFTIVSSIVGFLVIFFAQVLQLAQSGQKSFKDLKLHLSHRQGGLPALGGSTK